MGNLKSTIPQSISGKLATLTSLNKKLLGTDKKQIPTDLTQITEDIKSLNSMLRNCKNLLGIRLKFSEDAIKSNQKTPQKSIVLGDIKDLNKTKYFRIAFHLQEIYQLRQMFQNFNFAVEVRKSMRESTDSGHSQEIKKQVYNTPCEEQCTICLSNKLQIVLPCAHSFCKQCTHKYISEKEEKICPLCRKNFQMGCENFKKELYQIISSQNNDQQFQEEFKKEVYKIISVHNSRELNKILNRDLKMEKEEIEKHELIEDEEVGYKIEIKDDDDQ